ncbi:cytochrome c oxidase assembly protein (Pet191), putative [Talaromyces marneffei ATCC 18224]|nr:cytochrome c oxidase assembly protein (Pet191), putative [Talaromyces marneffei ATCC 18224]
MVQRNSPNDCLRQPLSDDLPVRCQQLSKALSDCKRGLVDMRKRFRGNAPISVNREIEGGGGTKSTQAPQQLYAGKPALSSVKEINGDEVQMDPEKTRGL